MVRRARYGITATFALAGALSAVWTVRVPALADKLHLDPGQLGITVLAWGLGALVVMPLVGLAPTYAWLLVAAGVFGVAFAALDIAMNAQASAVEQAYGRPLMSGMHAGWSVGAVAGGLLGAATAYAGWSFTRAVVVFAVAGVPVALALTPTYLVDRVAPGTAGRAAIGRLPRSVYLLGAIAFAAFMIEGSVADWSSLYLRDTLGATEGLAALGYPLFEATMIVGRLAGDRVRVALSDRRLLVVAGIAVSAVSVLVVAASRPPAALVGFCLVGLAVCTVAPVALSLAGRAGPRAIARTTSLGYLGLLLGPTVIGLLAGVSSLRVGLGVSVVLGLALAGAAKAL